MSAGLNCIVSAGINGCFAACWYCEAEKRIKIAVGYVGVDGIEADVAYKLDASGKFVKVV